MMLISNYGLCTRCSLLTLLSVGIMCECVRYLLLLLLFCLLVVIGFTYFRRWSSNNSEYFITSNLIALMIIACDCCFASFLVMYTYQNKLSRFFFSHVLVVVNHCKFLFLDYLCVILLISRARRVDLLHRLSGIVLVRFPSTYDLCEKIIHSCDIWGKTLCCVIVKVATMLQLMRSWRRQMHFCHKSQSRKIDGKSARFLHNPKKEHR